MRVGEYALWPLYSELPWQVGARFDSYGSLPMGFTVVVELVDRVSQKALVRCTKSGWPVTSR